MEKKEVFMILILLLVALGFSYWYNFVYYSDIGEVCFNDDQACFAVEIADNNEERQRGLMFRESLADNTGMLFIFDSPGAYSFWMKNTPIPLDMIWISSDLEVVFIQENALPCEEDPCESYGPEEEALYVLEVNSGIVEEIGLKIGDIIRFK